MSETIVSKMILYGIAKFALDFLRDSHNGIYISANQIVCLLFVISASIIYIRSRNVRNCDEM